MTGTTRTFQIDGQPIQIDVHQNGNTCEITLNAQHIGKNTHGFEQGLQRWTQAMTQHGTNASYVPSGNNRYVVTVTGSESQVNKYLDEAQQYFTGMGAGGGAAAAAGATGGTTTTGSSSRDRSP